ncbi:MAG: hypothetical protein ACO2O4_01785 [Minisyncoccia bacterium]|jgi:hypothetical protein
MKYKKFFILGLAFFIGLISGGFFRLWIFSHTQVYLFEKNFIEKHIAQTKLGGKTPEETWAMFVSELEKDNLDNAIQFIISNEQKNYKFYFEKLKKDGKFEELIKRIKNKKIIQLPKKIGMKEDEVLYTYLTEEEIKKEGEKLIEKQYFKDTLKIGEKLKVPEEEIFQDFLLDEIPTIKFKYNKYTGKWIIKELLLGIY